MKNFKIKTKLFLLAIFMLTGMAALAFVSLSYMDRMNKGTTEISEIWLPAIFLATPSSSLTLYDDVSDLLLDVVEYNKEGAEEANRNGDRLYSQAGRIVIIALIVIPRPIRSAQPVSFADPFRP